MRTVSKALKILDLFTEDAPVLGLAEIAALTGLDRATCHRMLKVFEEHGYVTRPLGSKKYTLGATVLRLARTREFISPATPALQAIVDALAQKTTETCHASLIAGQQIATVAVKDGTRSNRVHVGFGARISPHATATGLICLAYGNTDFVEHGLADPLPAYTPFTTTDAEALQALVSTFRSQGFSVADRSFDSDVIGVGVPFFGADAMAAGALATATPASRMDDATLRCTVELLIEAAFEATSALGGRIPEEFLRSTAVNRFPKSQAAG